MRERRAFTLVELLLVISIVALLVSLLVPSIADMRQSARAASCLSQVRSLQMAHLSYINENKSRFVLAGLPHDQTLSEDPDEQVAWIATLKEYYASDLVVHSPLDTSPHWPLDQGGQGVPAPMSNRLRQTSYGRNIFLTQFSPIGAIDPSQMADRISDVRNPGATVDFLIMAYEGAYAAADHVHVEQWSLPGTDDNFTLQQASQQMQLNAVKGPETHVDGSTVGDGHWEAQSNYGFLDGHVATLRFHRVYRDHEFNHFDPDLSWQYAQQTGFVD